MDKRAYVLLVIPFSSSESSTKTGGISSKPSTQKYADGWDQIFGSKTESKPHTFSHLN